MGFPPGDFKSPASAIPPPGPNLLPPRTPSPLRTIPPRRRAQRGRGLHGLPHPAHVVLVLDLAHQLLDDVLERDDPDWVPHRVHHDCHLPSNPPEFLELLRDR